MEEEKCDTGLPLNHLEHPPSLNLSGSGLVVLYLHLRLSISIYDLELVKKRVKKEAEKAKSIKEDWLIVFLCQYASAKLGTELALRH